MPTNLETLDLTKLEIGELNGVDAAFRLLSAEFEHGGAYLMIAKQMIRLIQEERQRRVSERWGLQRKPALF